MAVYQLRTFKDIYDAVLEELQVQSGDTTAKNRIKRDINIVYQELLAEKRWWWLEGAVDVVLPSYINSGTASVTQNSASVTLSVAPTSSKTGFYFAVDGFNEVYTIESHTASSTTLKLSVPYAGSTSSSASYRIWTDKVALPTDCKETIEVWHDFHKTALDNVGRQEFQRYRGLSPKAEGKPTQYFTGDFVDPGQASTISSLPSLSTRASAGTVRTLIFASGLPSSITNAFTSTHADYGKPIRLRISAAGSPEYNGDVFASSVSTTTNTNDTLTYTGVGYLTESATADTSMTIKSMDQETSYDRYRALVVYPSQSDSNITLHCTYLKDAPPLENDTDEPVLPVEDRTVLLYGALARAWPRYRNPEEGHRNEAKYQNKLAKMAGKVQDALDTPRLVPNKRYLSAKRDGGRKFSLTDSSFAPGAGSGAQNITGTASSVATFDSTGQLTGSSTISTTELSYLDDVAALTSVTLADNTSSAATAVSWAYATYDSIIVEYSLKRGSAKASGRLHICTDGTNAGIAQSEASVGTHGVVFTVDISGSDLRLRYTTTSTGTACTMKYKAHRWLA